MAVTEVTSANFQEEVLNSDKPVLVDFWAIWCGPCMQLSPLVEELSEERSDIKFCKVNCDQEMMLSQQYRINAIPALLLFENGELKRQSVGSVPKPQLISFLDA